MTNHVEARYDESDKMFLPPLRTLGFNPKLTLNDSLLAQSYIEAYDISYPEAIHRIEDEVNELRQVLETEGSYELNDIGILFLNDDGNYEFSPCEAGILTPALYALSSFEIEKVVPTVQVKTAELREPKEQPAEAETKKAEKVPALSISAPEEPSEARTVSIKVSLLRNLAAAALVLLAFLLFPKQLSNEAPQKATIDSSLLTKVMPKNSITGTTAISNEAKVQTPEAKAENPKQEIQSSESQVQISAPYYTLVLASHVTKKNAAAYVEELKTQGFEARVISHTSTKVIYGRYDTEEEAYNQLRQLRGNRPFAEAWVLKMMP